MSKLCDECETVAHCMKHGCIPKQQALDKKAENARELGLDYEPPTYTFKQPSELPITLFEMKPNYNMTFNRDGKQIGVLDFNGPEMVFTGDADESAKVFFDFIAGWFKGRLEQERADERELLSARIKELEHQAARYKVLRTWDLGGYDHGLYSPEEVDKAVDDCIKDNT